MKKVITIIMICIAVLGNTLNAQEKKEVKKTEEIKIKTSSQCGMCKETIEKAMAFEKGVKTSDLDIKTKILTVNYNPAKTTPEKIRLAISKVGYDADDMKANEEAYHKLPKCCQHGGHDCK
jgi:mercuric ion binding protein